MQPLERHKREKQKEEKVFFHNNDCCLKVDNSTDNYLRHKNNSTITTISGKVEEEAPEGANFIGWGRINLLPYPFEFCALKDEEFDELQFIPFFQHFFGKAIIFSIQNKIIYSCTFNI